MTRAKLTDKQKTFVDQYLVDLNAKRAYRAAYPAVKSDDVAASAAARLLKNVKVAAAVQAGMDARSERTGIRADQVLSALSELAFSDIGDILDFAGDSLVIRSPSSISPAARRAIASVKVRRVFKGAGEDKTPVDLIEFKLADKLGALDKLARHLGLYREQKDEGDSDPLLLRLAELLEKLK